MHHYHKHIIGTLLLIISLVYSCNFHYDNSDNVDFTKESVSSILKNIIFKFYHYSDSIRELKSDRNKKYSIIFYNERDSDFMILTETAVFDSFPQFLGYDTIQGRLVGFYSFKSKYYRDLINESSLIKNKLFNEKPSRIEPLNVRYKIEDKNTLIFKDKNVFWFPPMDEI